MSDAGLLVLRLGVGLTFAAHGAQKAFGWWSGPGAAGWRGAMERMGYRPARAWAAASTAVEMIGGLLLALGVLTPVAAAALLAQSIVIVVHVHLPKGFWNTKGGIEYPLALAAGAVAAAASGPGRASLDAALAIRYPDASVIVLLALGAVAGLAALAVPRLSGRTRSPQAVGAR